MPTTPEPVQRGSSLQNSSYRGPAWGVHESEDDLPVHESQLLVGIGSWTTTQVSSQNTIPLSKLGRRAKNSKPPKLTKCLSEKRGQASDTEWTALKAFLANHGSYEPWSPYDAHQRAKAESEADWMHRRRDKRSIPADEAHVSHEGGSQANRDREWNVSSASNICTAGIPQSRHALKRGRELRES